MEIFVIAHIQEFPVLNEQCSNGIRFDPNKMNDEEIKKIVKRLCDRAKEDIITKLKDIKNGKGLT